MIYLSSDSVKSGVRSKLIGPLSQTMAFDFTVVVPESALSEREKK